MLRSAVVLLLMVCAASFAQADKGFLPLDDYVKAWQISKQFTLEVADKMPADQYAFKPTPEEMGFGEMMVHIAAASVFRFNQLTGVKPPFFPTRIEKPSKADTMKMLAESFDYVIALLPKITPEQMDKMLHVGWRGRPEASGRAMMQNMFVHVAHHRAQAEVYLRLRGITPPEYAF